MKSRRKIRVYNIMLLAAHSIAGATAGEYVRNPILAFLLGFILHFVLDAIPHFDTTDKGKLTFRQIALVVVDGLVGLGILFYLYFNFSVFHLSFWLGVLGANVPDLLDNIPLWQKWFRKSKWGKPFHLFHYKIHAVDLKPFLGILVQYILILFFVYLFIVLR